MNPQKRAEIFARLAAANPNPTTELAYRTPYELLVSVILSAQATDKSVNLATAELFKIADTPQKMVALGVDGLIPYIKTIGLFRTKAKNVVETSRLLLERHGGEVPSTREALEQLPGVGRKTANVVLNTAFGQDTMAVDTHIFRVANRTGIAPGKNPLEVEERLVKFVPGPYRRNAHHWLILHGRYVCTARKPACPALPDPRPVRVPAENERRLTRRVQSIPRAGPPLLFRRVAQVPRGAPARRAGNRRGRSDAPPSRVSPCARRSGPVPRPRLHARGRPGESVPAHEPARRDRGAARDRPAAGDPRGVRPHPRRSRRPARRAARRARMPG